MAAPLEVGEAVIDSSIRRKRQADTDNDDHEDYLKANTASRLDYLKDVAQRLHSLHAEGEAPEGVVPKHITALVKEDSDEPNLGASMGKGLFNVFQPTTMKDNKNHDTHDDCSHTHDDVVMTEATKSEEHGPPVGSKNPTVELPKNQLCCICFKRFSINEVASTDCSHEYCYDCLRQFFIEASTNEWHFPLRCCGSELSVKQVEDLLSTEQRNAYTETKEKIMSPQMQMRRCSNNECQKMVEFVMFHGSFQMK